MNSETENRVKAHWIIYKNQCESFDPMNLYSDLVCSHCGKFWTLPNPLKVNVNYCPSCGAKMDRNSIEYADEVYLIKSKRSGKF